jgi:trans-aconitate 2-methyltransferase
MAAANTTTAPSGRDWSAAQYLKFEGERTRPARDLLAQVPSTLQPKRIIDLGCGPGNSTAILRGRYPHAHLSGMDSSPDMIAKARERLPDVDFQIADLKTYQPPSIITTAGGSNGGKDAEDVDLYFSNAVFQWLDGEDRLGVIKRLMRTQKPGGVFAWQVPDNFLEYSHAAMRDIAATSPWAEVFAVGKDPTRELIQSPQQLYDELKPLCSHMSIWHTYYQVILENHEGIVEWVKGTGLRPFLDPLPEELRVGFLKAYLERLKKHYPTQHDGKVLLRYPRLFVITMR